ncbi:MAG TPA: GAF domain-containing protein, partial [Dermatophilaceae bacterium]|nr:GAF domain-containing protein [Dermatophilaceae bacterium]
MNVTDRRRRITAAREGFLATGSALEGAVPHVVAASWMRSLSAGVDAETSQALYHSDLDTSSRLVRCSRPIIDRLSDETANIPLSIAVTDGKARVLTRVDNSPTIGRMLDEVSFAPGFGYAEGGMGTNGVGTVFESGQPIQIVGPEHFHERLQPFACSGTPIRDPLTGRIEGVLDISCLTEHSSPLMHALVRSAAHDIERNLLIDGSQCQQALFETFVRADARSRGAVMAVGGTVVMANTVAQGLLTPMERATLQDHARHLMTRRDRTAGQLELSTGKVVSIR